MADRGRAEAENLELVVADGVGWRQSVTVIEDGSLTIIGQKMTNQTFVHFISLFFFSFIYLFFSCLHLTKQTFVPFFFFFFFFLIKKKKKKKKKKSS
jgi:hypothetical protein